MRFLKRSSPVSASLDSHSKVTSPALPLSTIAATLPVVRTLPAGGSGPNTSIACSPCTSIAELKVPILSKGMPPMPTITA